jgi:hypothetical protein
MAKGLDDPLIPFEKSLAEIANPVVRPRFLDAARK